jgi:hypothetical protein
MVADTALVFFTVMPPGSVIQYVYVVVVSTGR